MEEQLAEFVKRAIEIAEKTGQFVIEEAPLLLKEFYAWRIFTHSYLIAIAIIIILLIILVIKKVGKKEEEEYFHFKMFGRYYETDEPPFLLSMGIGSIVGIFAVFMLLDQLYYLAFILIAPKLYLIEYFIK